jgi:hypothetical protein
MNPARLAYAPLALFCACSMVVTTTPEPDAPRGPPSGRVDVLGRPPQGARLVGHVHAAGSKYAGGAGECRLQLEEHAARELGATAIVITGETPEGVFAWSGAKCDADAYR